jgi:hypothetical protein
MQNRRVLRTGGFFVADGILLHPECSLSQYLWMTVTNAWASDHQYGLSSCMDRWAGKEYHYVDQA